MSTCCDTPAPGTRPMLSMDEARARMLAQARPIAGQEDVPLLDALNRILAVGQVSAIDVPGADNSAMDGYALRVADLSVSGEASLPVSQRIPAGQAAQPLQAGTAARIFTGAPVPAGADTVIIQEVCREEGGVVHFPVPLKAGANIRRAGEDIGQGSEVLAAGTRLTPQALGLAASVGLGRLPVYRRLRVAVLSTGDELVEPGGPLAHPGQIYNSNRYTLISLLRRLECEVIDLGRVRDDYAETCAVLDQAAGQADLILSTGGVSVGEEDHVKHALEARGRLDLWRIAVKPGKPLAFGQVGDAFFIGLPGNPVSSFVTFQLFVKPFIAACQGESGVKQPSFAVAAGFDWPHPDKRREFLRARLLPGEAGEFRVEIYPSQSSGVLSSTVWADGLVDVPPGRVIHAGDRVSFMPFLGLLD